MERNFVGHMIASICNTVNETWGITKVLIGIFIGLVLTVLVLKLSGNSSPSFGTFALLTTIFSLISYIGISYIFKKMKI